MVVAFSSRLQTATTLSSSSTRCRSCKWRRSGWVAQRPRLTTVRAQSSPVEEPEEERFALAPSKLQSPVGQVVAYCLQMEPHLFQSAVETEFIKLKEQQEAEEAEDRAQREAQQGEEQAASGSSELVLYRRMAELRAAERRHAVEDLMYACILDRFRGVGVSLLATVEPIEEDTAALKALTEGVHSQEALEMVKGHLLSVLGPVGMAPPNTMVRMSKLQAAQVYAASAMFGYFIRRVDQRFQLARSLGMLPEDPQDAVARLERLLSMVDSDASDQDSVSPVLEQQQQQGWGDVAKEVGAGAGAGANASASEAVDQERQQQQLRGGLVPRRKGALRRYIETFDQATMVQTARLVSVEGAALVERQTKALFGDLRELQAQMQAAVGQGARSLEEVMQRVEQAVAEGAVDTVTMSIATQRRAVLEAVAFGTFLRDIETKVDADYSLLTPVPALAGQQ